MRTERWPQLLHDDYPWLWIHQNLGRQPRWLFPNTLAGNGLRCPRLNFDNYEDIWPPLAAGDTTFVNREYRERDQLYQQVFSHYAYAPYSGNNGAVDYLIVETPGKNEEYRAGDYWNSDGRLSLGEGERLAGILHVYELSHERYDGRMPNPLLGIQLTTAARGTGVADRAMDVLERFVSASYPEITGMTVCIKPANERSLRFFRRRGYRDTDEYGDTSDVFLVKET